MILNGTMAFISLGIFNVEYHEILISIGETHRQVIN